MKKILIFLCFKQIKEHMIIKNSYDTPIYYFKMQVSTYLRKTIYMDSYKLFSRSDMFYNKTVA